MLAASIAERGTFAIDPYAEQTVDLARRGDHFYSNKAIGVPILGAAVWWGLRHLTPLRDRMDLDPQLLYWTRVVTTSLPAALFAGLFSEAALVLGASPAGAIVLSLAYMLGTPALLHGSTFSGHQMAAAFCFTGFSTVVIGLRRSRRCPVAMAAGGFLVGWGVLSDYIAAVIAIAITIYVVAETGFSRKYLAAFLAGAAIPASILLFYNTVCFGSPLSLSYAHQTTDIMAEGSRHGLLGITLPAPKTLFMLLVSPSRGLFILSPFLLLACLGLTWLMQSPVWRKEAMVLAACFLGPLIVNAAFYGWHGGWAYGPRYLTAGVPFLAIAAAPVISRFPIVFSGLVVLSVAFYVPAGVGCQYVPAAFANPLVEAVFPLLAKGYWVDSPLGWQGAARPFALLALVIFLMPSMVYAALLARSRRSGAAAGRGPSRRVQFGALAGVAGAALVIIGVVRTDNTAAAGLHGGLGKLLADPWDVRPDLLPQAEQEFALADGMLREDVRRKTPDFISQRFASLAREAGSLWRAGRHEDSDRIAARAETVLEQWLERLPPSNRGGARFDAGTCLALAGRADLGLKQLERLPDLPEEHPTRILINALNELQRGRMAEALAIGRRLVACCRESVELALLIRELTQSAKNREHHLVAACSLMYDAAKAGSIPERLRVAHTILNARLHHFKQDE
ncbi:MAG: hypothetical protein DME34_01415 [Verrucomicrobia bacterium]|nr:MAG: hypothetical protein DME34_01415 [Verrucomicrobiota bacterium]